MNDRLVTLSTHRFGSFICRQAIDLNTDSIIFTTEQGSLDDNNKTCNNGVWERQSKLVEITYKGAIILDNVVVGNIKQNNHGTMAFTLTPQLTICHKPFTLSLPFPESVSQYLEQNQTSVALLSVSPHYNAPKDQIVFTTSISTLRHECYIEAEVILAGFLLTLLTSIH